MTTSSLVFSIQVKQVTDRGQSVADLGSELHAEGIAARRAFEETGDAETLAWSLTLLRRAVLNTDPEDLPRFTRRLVNLMIVLMDLAELTGDPDLVAEAVLVGEEVVAAADPADPQFVFYLGGLASCLSRTDDRAALDRARTLFRQTLALLPRGHPLRAGHLNGLAYAIQMSAVLGDHDSFGELAEVSRELLALTPSGHPDHLTNMAALGNALWNLGVSDPSVREEAVNLYRRAVAEAPPDHAQRGMFLVGLGMILWRRDMGSWSLAKAVTPGSGHLWALRSGLAVLALDDPSRVDALLALVEALNAFYLATGESREVADELSAAASEVLQLIGPEHPARRNLEELVTMLGVAP
jgi:hypothetical protein